MNHHHNDKERHRDTQTGFGSGSLFGLGQLFMISIAFQIVIGLLFGPLTLFIIAASAIGLLFLSFQFRAIAAPVENLALLENHKNDTLHQ